MRIEKGIRKYEDGELTRYGQLPEGWNPEAIERGVREEMTARAEKEAKANLEAFKRGLNSAKNGEAKSEVFRNTKPCTVQGVIASWGRIETDESKADGYDPKWMKARVENAAGEVVWREARVKEELEELRGAYERLFMAKKGAFGFPTNADWNESKKARDKALAEEINNALLEGLRGLGLKVEGVDKKTDLLLAVAVGLADKETRDNVLVDAFKRFFAEVGPSAKPGGCVVLAHFNDFILDPKNKAALGRARAFRTFRLKYGEWLGLGRPDTGKEYRDKLEAAKRQQRKERRAGTSP